MKQQQLQRAGTPAYGATYKNEYTSSGREYRNSLGAYILNVQYPTIYAEEALRKITNSDNTTNNSITGLGLSEARESFITRANEKVTKTVANGIVAKTVKTIQPAKTSYSLANAAFISALETATNSGEVSNAELILPDEENTRYWVASRCVNSRDGLCRFVMRYIHNGGLGGGRMLESSGSAYGFASGLFPIITITSGTLTSRTETTGTFDYTPANQQEIKK